MKFLIFVFLAGLLPFTANAEQHFSIQIVESRTVVVGEVKREAVLRVIKENLPALKKLYVRLYKENPAPWGYLTVEVVVNDKGQAIDKKLVLTELNTGERNQDTELVKEIAGWKFPPPPTQVADLKIGLFFSDGERGHNRIANE